MLASATVLHVICVGIVAIIVYPIGFAVMCYVDVDLLSFSAAEALLSASLGFGLAEWLISPWR
jgi:hypothetical protein